MVWALAVTVITLCGAFGFNLNEGSATETTATANIHKANTPHLVSIDEGTYQYQKGGKAGLGELMGSLLDPRRDEAVANIDVDIYLAGGTFVDTTTSGMDGKFSFINLPYDDYHIQVDHSLYVPLDMYTTVESDEPMQLPLAWLVPQPVIQQGDIGGKVIDVLTGNSIFDVALDFKAGIDPPASDPVLYSTTTTGSFGVFSYEVLGMEAGVYTAYASKTNYRDGKFFVYVLGADRVSPQNGTLSPIIYGDEMRIVLTWGIRPLDLDSHLWAPDPFGAGKVHLYYSVIPPYGTHPWGAYFDLDLDDTASYGPETTTIHQWESETYCFHVHDYSNQISPWSKKMSNSGTTVTVLTATETLFFYITPDTTATAWAVFTIDGATRAITTLNTYYHQPSDILVGQDCIWM